MLMPSPDGVPHEPVHHRDQEPLTSGAASRSSGASDPILADYAAQESPPVSKSKVSNRSFTCLRSL